MSYAITLTTQDGHCIQFEGEAEQTLQESAEAAGFFTPAVCKAGSCGACTARCTKGDYHLGEYNRLLLPENPYQHGDMLLCCSYPKSDLEISAPYKAAQIHTQQQAPREAEIVSIETIAERTVRLVIQLLPDPQYGISFEFEPGQFVELEFPELDLKRAYSIANAPNWEGKLEFLIRLQPNGQFSNFLRTTAKPGQHLQIEGPLGSFGISAQGLNPRCFIAGGTGLAPFLSILQRMAEWGEDHPTRLFIGVNNEQEIFCQEQLAALKQMLPQLQVDICVWQASENWTGFSGTPADALKAYLEKTEVLPDVFLCGPPMMVEAATQIALARGIPEERIFAERFA